jgi:hypothetical protein
MIYNVLILAKKCCGTIRPASEGIDDMELQLGVRLVAQVPMRSVAEEIIEDRLSSDGYSYDILDAEHWNMIFRDNDDYEAPVAHKVQGFVINEVFNRGPYSPYWHNKDNSRY